MSRTIFIVAILIAAAPYAPLSASSISALGGQQMKAFALMETKAIVVARLVKRVKTPDVAYVVFENLRVVRGKEPRKLLVFNYPEPKDPGSYDFPGFLKRRLKSLKEAELFLVTVGRANLTPLASWVPLSKGNQKAVIAEELKPYQELDKNRKRDPWEAVESENLFEQACVLCFYRRYATRKEIKKLLAEFVEKDQQPGLRFRLVSEALENLREKNEPLEPEFLARVFRIEVDGQNWARFAPRVRSHIVCQLETAKPSEHDKLIEEALNSTNKYLQRAALEVLCHRKIPSCLPGIRKSLKRLGYRQQAAQALSFQIGKPCVDEVLRLCLQEPNRKWQLRMSFDFLAEAVETRHVPTLRSLDDPKNREIHVSVNKLLIYAGDEEAATEYFRLVKSGAIKRLPRMLEGLIGKPDPSQLQHAAAFRESAKWFLGKRYRLEDGRSFTSSTEVLLHLRDPELGELILPLVEDDHFHHWALRYLVLIANEKYRPVFQKYTTDKRTIMRAYAWAGLARLGDRQAILKFAEMTALASDSMTRYYLRKHVLPRIEIAPMRKAWESERPPQQTTVERAVHLFVSEQLERN